MKEKEKESVPPSSAKIRSSKVNIKVDPKRMSKINISASTEEKKLAGDKGIKSGKVVKKLSKAEINQINLNVSGNFGKNKKGRPSLTGIKPKEVKLPAKLIKMKDMISLKYNDPIHDVKEVPRFDIYRPKK